jgi:sulfotransferase family protein
LPATYQLATKAHKAQNDSVKFCAFCALQPGWNTLNRLTRYSLTTTLHWLNFSTQTYRKLKQLHRDKPFDLIQYPNYSSCGLLSITLLRTVHVVRASSQPGWNAYVKRNFDSALTDRLEALQYRLTRNVHAPSRAIQKMLARDVRLIRTPFYVETRDWDTTVYNQFFKDKEFDRRFPNTKFILTVRKDTATYVGSLQGHHEREGIRNKDWIKPHWWDEVMAWSRLIGTTASRRSAMRTTTAPCSSILLEEPVRICWWCAGNGDGWDALSRFLNKRAPAEPFPHLR